MKLLAGLLLKSLRNRNPQLDLWGIDRRILYIACEDLMNYLKVHWGYTEQEETKLKEKIRSYFYENPQEFKEFVHLWTGIWIKKWNERVRLILRNENNRRSERIEKLLSKAEPVWRSLKDRDKIKDLVIEVLIRNGEICGTGILAEDMLKIELGLHIERKTYVERYEYLLRVVNKVLRKVREVSRNKGPLIFIKINKRIFWSLK